MKFWDSSAIVPLCVREPWTDRVTELLADDPLPAVWWATPVEVESALARLWREGALASTVADQARGRLSVLAAAWIGIEPTREGFTLPPEEL